MLHSDDSWGLLNTPFQVWFALLSAPVSNLRQPNFVSDVPVSPSLLILMFQSPGFSLIFSRQSLMEAVCILLQQLCSFTIEIGFGNYLPNSFNQLSSLLFCEILDEWVFRLRFFFYGVRGLLCLWLLLSWVEDFIDLSGRQGRIDWVIRREFPERVLFVHYNQHSKVVVSETLGSQEGCLNQVLMKQVLTGLFFICWLESLQETDNLDFIVLLISVFNSFVLHQFN